MREKIVVEDGGVLRGLEAGEDLLFFVIGFGED